jgi:ABC-type dipeptide/oligopeptide/nickel transport system ATPase subunit
MLDINGISVRRGKSVTLKDITLTLASGKMLAVVGESGAGKSTLINAILDLVPCVSGQITWSGKSVKTSRPALVMQEPRSAFNPRLSLRRSVMEPLVAARQTVDPAYLEQLCQGLEIVPDLLNRMPTEVSIGQAQRVGILRALIAAPSLVLFDEPLSALDAVTQKHTARLIADLQMQIGFAALVVTHDLGYATAFADDIAVLHAGRIEELSTVSDFVRAPQSAYGRTLCDAAIGLGALEQVA